MSDDAEHFSVSMNLFAIVIGCLVTAALTAGTGSGLAALAGGGGSLLAACFIVLNAERRFQRWENRLTERATGQFQLEAASNARLADAQSAVVAARAAEATARAAVLPALNRIEDAARLFYASGTGVGRFPACSVVNGRLTLVVRLQNCGVLVGRVGNLTFDRISWTGPDRAKVEGPASAYPKDARDGLSSFRTHDFAEYVFNPLNLSDSAPPNGVQYLIERASVSFAVDGDSATRTVSLGNIVGIFGS